jgi:protein-S-isoprenylcysteine O-methyltransferase Ste14
LIRIWGVAYAGCATRTREVKKAPMLVTNGPYAFIRNPLYFGNMFIYSGFIIATGALLPYLLYTTILFFAIQYSLIVSLEEKNLEELFGEQYIEYKHVVPRFYLRLSPYPDRTHVKANFYKALISEKTTFLTMALLLIILAARWYFMIE